MKSLSRRAIPAVAALDTDAETVWPVLVEARQESPLLYDQVKRMIGHMVRQIMESPLVGYEHVRNVPFTSWIFSTGARYRDPAWRLWIYVHRNRDPDGEEMFCLAKTKSLSDLYNPPSNISSWIYYRRCALQHELEFVLSEPLTEWGCTWHEIWNEIRNIDSGYLILRND